MNIRAVLDRFATDVFRKQADCDYISARANFRMHLRQQFLWSAQQSIEKYLKAILLFNGLSTRFQNGSTKELGHDLKALIAATSAIPIFKLTFEAAQDRFINYLAEQGPNRYISKSAFNTGNELRELDGTVWQIRRYCQYFGDDAQPRVRALAVEAALRPEHRDRPQRFRIAGGELEAVIERPKSNPGRRALVYANLYYGAIRRTRVSYRTFSSAELPPNEQDWLRVDWDLIKPYVRL